MTFLEICQRLHREAGLSGTGPSSVVSQVGMSGKIVDWARDSWTDLQRMFPNWRFLWNETNFSTTAGTKDYDPVDDLGLDLADIDVIKLYSSIADETWVDPVSWHDMNIMDTGSVISGRPQYYTYTPNQKIRFWPTPDKAYTTTLQYLRNPQILTSNLDVPLMPGKFHMLIVYHALHYYAGHDDAAQLYQVSVQEMKRLLGQLKVEQLPEVTTNPSVFA